MPYDLKKLCLERGPYSPQENQAIFERHFRNAPRRWLRLPLVKYGLGDKKVLDVGCSFGEALIFFGPGSRGVDIHARAVQFARGLGLSALQGDFLDPGVLEKIPPRSFDAVWCSQVLEHVAAPHDALLAMRSRLKPGGLLLLGLPPIPHWRWAEAMGRVILRLFFGRPTPLGYTAEDHIYAFTRRTSRFLLERAGFQVIEQAAFVSRRPAVNRLFNVLCRPAVDRLVTVARQIPDWKYPPKSTRRLTETGWVFRNDYVDDDGK
ncbi:MAG: class I SAM-dependent methyltransferase [Proteobacteria bacterium]|nr:class I SAM-dependent methyltransferase [Pseudomonadota bacterium]MBU1742237.1 class I SAM-dependent methyltransferase [Pseudomonadota bacterium]